MDLGPRIGSLYWGSRYDGVHYIAVFTHANYCNFAGAQKTLRYNVDFDITGTLLYRRSLYRGHGTVRRLVNCKQLVVAPASSSQYS